MSGRTVHLIGGQEKYGTIVYPHLLDIAGADGRAKVMLVPAGWSARREQGGPEVPGPWADLMLQATVISDPPTPYEHGIDLQPGDRVRVGGDVPHVPAATFVVAVSDGRGAKGTRGWVRSGYPILLTEEEAQA